MPYFRFMGYFCCHSVALINQKESIYKVMTPIFCFSKGNTELNNTRALTSLKHIERVTSSIELVLVSPYILKSKTRESILLGNRLNF